MKKPRNNSTTLIEIIIALALFSVIILSIVSIDRFSRSHVLTADRRVKLQNQLYQVLEHMSKKIASAIGNEKYYSANSVVRTNPGGRPGEQARIEAYIDANNNGKRDSLTSYQDYWVAYCFYGSGGGANKYQIQYCDQCNPGSRCSSCSSSWKTLSNKIINFVPTKPVVNNILSDNFVTLEITGRFDPSKASSIDNPEVTLRTRVKMPAVSTN